MNRKLIIGICDDEACCRAKLQKAVNILCKQLGIEVTLLLFSSGEETIEEDASNLDVLLLDEELSDGNKRKLNGCDVRKKLENRNQETLIIYITSHSEYMQDCFGANVMGFITKESLGESKHFLNIFLRCIERLNKSVKIAYIESQGHSIRIVKTDGTVTKIRCNLKDIEEKCNIKNLVRCQKSYLVNLDYIDDIIGNFDRLILKNGLEISVGRKWKKLLKIKYLSYKERLMLDLFGDD